MLEVRLLGTFEIIYRNETVIIPSRPAQTLFAYLILSAGTSHRRELLAGLLWPDSLEETARDNLRHALWRIRKALPSKLVTQYLDADNLTIAFNGSADYWLDVSALEKAGDNISTDELMTILSSYQGELLPGFYDQWVVLEREHLNSIFEHKMARLLSVLEEEKRWPDVLEWGERWIKLGRKPEPAFRALLSAHAAMGDMSKVAATYERCVKSLGEFGFEPSEQTRLLYEDLKSGKEKPGGQNERASISPNQKSSTPSTIPVPLTSFIGREKELKEIGRLLSNSRLLTLTGSGGVGKTRLAIRTAGDSIKKFKDGVVWIDLASLSEGNLIPQEIAQALHIRETPPEPLVETLKSYLNLKDLLIVLDNCEHLIMACAQIAEQLLAACPGLKILATSIEALGLFTETIWHVPSLPLPERRATNSLQELREYASIELFVERAGHAKAGFILTEQNVRSVAKICQRLDGIPLAIELAAARIKILSVEEIASRLDDRFSLLTAGNRTAIPRHQTLRATIDWSHDLLTEDEKTLFRRLAVFAGGFTLEAAEAVCSLEELKRRDILDLLGKLVDKSLVIVEQESPAEETRYRLLETVRQYESEKLLEKGEAQAIRDRHLGFYMDLAEKAELNMYGRETAAWFGRLDKELDNIRAAIEWSTNSGKATAALRITGALVYFWFAHGYRYSEWNDRVQQALSRPEGRERTLARAKVLNGIGFLYWTDIYPIDRRPELEEALSIGMEFGDQRNTATSLCNLGLVESIQGNYQAARAFLEQSLKIWRDMGPEEKTGYACTLIFLGDLALMHEQVESARSIFEEAIAILRELGEFNYLAFSVRRLGQLSWHAGNFHEAIALCKESLNLNKEIGDQRGLLACLAGFAAIAVAQGKFERAAILMGAVETQLASIGIRLLLMDRIEYDRNLALLRAELDEKTLTKIWAKAKLMPLDEAIAFATKET